MFPAELQIMTGNGIFTISSSVMLPRKDSFSTASGVPAPYFARQRYAVVSPTKTSAETIHTSGFFVPDTE